jgi:hypothetical protein
MIFKEVQKSITKEKENKARKYNNFGIFVTVLFFSSILFVEAY